MARNFARELSEIRREINEQRCAQTRALGAMNFYKKTISYNWKPDTYENQFFHITVTAKAGEAAPPFVQLHQTDTNDYVAERIKSTERSIVWNFYFFHSDPLRLTFVVTSSSDFDVKIEKGAA